MINSVLQYFDHVENLIWRKNDENARVDITGPRWLPRKNNWEVVTFRAVVRFEDGHILDLADNFSIDSSAADGWIRKFSYFFGAPEGDQPPRIFLFDTHGLYGVGGHLHPDDDERLSVGDPRLNGFSPENIDIMDVFEFTNAYFDGRRFAWVAA